MVTHRFTLASPEPFWFEDTVFAHGWVRLLPYHWDEGTRSLTRSEWLPSGQMARVHVLSPAPGEAVRGLDVEVRSDAPLAAGDEEWLQTGLRRAFVLDETFGGWWERCAEEPGLRQALLRRQARMLRSPTVFEDVVKTVCSINTTWGQTKAMVRNLVVHFGGGAALEEERAFPSAEALAETEPNLLRERGRVGYRADTLSGIARAVAEGRLDLEGLQDPALPDETVSTALRAIRGLGPYAVAHVRMLLGRYDDLPIDTWLRRTVRDAWFGGSSVTDREILHAFERFRPYRSLAFRFYDWQGALRTEVWTSEAARG